MDFKGKTVFITGASHGIGQYTARLLCHRCARLVLTARSMDKLNEIKAELAQFCAIEIFAADMYDLNQTEALVRFVNQFDVDIFVNNAGKSICRPIAQSTHRMHDFTRTMSLNYYSSVVITLSLVERGRPFHIINVSTLNVLLPPTPYWASYVSSKSAVDLFFKSVVAELKPKVTLATIYFPLVATRMITPTAAYRNVRAMSVERAASIVARGGNWRPWWSGVAVLMAAIFRPLYQRLSMQIIDKADGN